MRNEKIVTRLLLVTLFLLNIFVVYKYLHVKKTSNEELVFNSDFSKCDSALFNNIYNVAMQSNGKKINRNIEFLLFNNKVVTLREILNKKSPLLVFDFVHVSCKTCFEDEMERLANISKDIGSENIIFVSEYRDKREQYVLEKKYGVTILNINKNRFGLPVEDEYYPFMFIIDSNFVAKDVYIPTKEFFALGNVYYNIIYDKYFDR